MNRILILACAVATAAAVPLHAQAPTLTLDDAIREALAKNPQLIALRREYDAVRTRPSQQRFLMPPTIEAEIWQWPLDTINPLDVNMYMFTMRQDIPGPGKRALKVAVAEKERERSASEIAVEARSVIADVKRAYAELFVSRQAVATNLRSIDLLHQLADLATARYAAAQSGQQDALKTALEISRLHSELVSLQERVQLAAAQLDTLLGRSPDAPVDALTPIASAQPLPALDDLMRRAIEAHPELRAAQLEIERTEALVAVAERDYKPDFMVGGGYQLMPRSAGAWMVMAGMTWPNAPWSRGGVDAKKAEAVANVETARARREAAVSAVRLAVQQAYVRATSAATRASLARTTIVPQTEQTIAAARVAYQTGRGDISSVVELARMRLDAELDAARAQTELAVARADLERAVGDDLFTAEGGRR